MRFFFSLAAAVCAISLGLFAQDDGKPKAKAKNLAPKNLVLLTPEDFRPLMDVFVGALGLASRGGCNYCHDADRSADTPRKSTALMMLAMTREINAKFPDGKQHVTCYTCHRGDPHPAMEAPKQEAGKQ
jgi:photosynthetic reaction center cytochrome c subunit